MIRSFDRKSAIAAAVLAAAVGAAHAQSTPAAPPLNTTTSPNPLQKNPVDGTPSSANGARTQGDGTGSSRTPRPDAGTPPPSVAPDTGTGTRTGTGTGTGAGSMNMNTMEPTSAGTPVRAARRDRG